MKGQGIDQNSKFEIRKSKDLVPRWRDEFWWTRSFGNSGFEFLISNFEF